MRAPEEFQKAVIDNNIKMVTTGRCSICNCPIGFTFQKDNPRAYFDGSCDCNSVFGPRFVTWQDVADHYNRSNKKEELDRAWGFVNE